MKHTNTHQRKKIHTKKIFRVVLLLYHVEGA
jgi:hypothetical protein